jgi:putative tRNA adenosine deaminase-associated protein
MRGVVDGTEQGFAAVVWREDGQWEAGMLPVRVLDDLDGIVAAVRQQPGEGGAIGLVDVADEFFIVIRVRGPEVTYLLSDVTASAEWDLARQVVERLGLPVPEEEDLDLVVPVGDLSIFADLGLDEMELGAVLADIDAYADEMLGVLARRMGWSEPYDRALSAVHL